SASGAHWLRSNSVQRLVASLEQKPALEMQWQDSPGGRYPFLASASWPREQSLLRSFSQNPKLLNNGSSYQRCTVAWEPSQAPVVGSSGRAPGPGPKNLMNLGASFSRVGGPDAWGTYSPPPPGEALMAWMRSVTSLGPKVPSS